MNFPDSPSGGDLFNGFIYNATLGVWDVATSDGYFAVTNSGSGAYLFNGFGTDGDSNPTLYLHRGKTYEFAVDATGHPFYIKTVSGTGTSNAYSDGVTNNGTASGTIKFVVPQDAPSKLYYNCSAHAAMAGEIIIPRAAQIDDLSDVDTSTTAPTDGQVLTWDNANSQWEPATASGGIALTDLSVTTNAAGTAALTYTNSTGVFSYTPPDLSSYLTSYTVTQSDVTTHQAALSITESQISDLGTYLTGITNESIGDLSDVNSSISGSGNTVLGWDSTNSRWDAQIGITPNNVNSYIDAHINTSTASTNEVLSWNGSDYDWVAQSGGGSSYGDSDVDTHLNTSTASANEVLSWTGSDYDWVAQSGGGGGGASVTTSDTAPSSPSAGDLWFDTTTLRLYVYYNDGSSSQWVKANPSGSGSGASVAVQETAPSNPSSGDMWFDSNSLKTYIYYNDGDSNQWVQANPTGGGSGSGGSGVTTYDDLTARNSASPSAGDLAFVTSNKALYLYDGAEWDRISAGADESPVIITDPTSVSLSSNGATSTVTMAAQDPEGFSIIYGIAYNTSDGSRPSQLSADTTINQSTGVYTFTPSTNASDEGSFKARLSASDGVKSTTRTIDCTLAFNPTITYIMYGGGGGGGSHFAGGGGAGGLIDQTSSTTTLTAGTTYAITVGSGGSGGTYAGSNGGNKGASGGDTTFLNQTAIGGGGGGARRNTSGQEALSGGSGGGGGNEDTNLSGAAGTVGQGNAGGDGHDQTSSSAGGGGGGAGGAGGNASAGAGGTGGAGSSISITGSAITYCQGGSGATQNTDGVGGGSSDMDGAYGGGGAGASSGGTGGDGSVGAVIISSTHAYASATGSPTLTMNGALYVYTFTSDGSITF